MELLRERQRRELQIARLRLRHNQPSNGNILLAGNGAGFAGFVDNSGNIPRGPPVHIPYHHSTATSRLTLPSSISLPGSPPQNSFLGQHLAPRDVLVCIYFIANDI